MKRYGVGALVFLGLVLFVSGCAKKASEDAGLTSPVGFDTATTEELAQLPQASTGASQQTAIEVLPIESTPVTPALSLEPQIEKESAAVSETVLERNKKIQTALKAAGLYQGSIDGKIGPASKRAIETFQKNNGLKVDGKVGPKTWAALEASLSGSVSASSETQAVS